MCSFDSRESITCDDASHTRRSEGTREGRSWFEHRSPVYFTTGIGFARVALSGFFQGRYLRGNRRKLRGALTKFIAAGISGSSAMLTEGLLLFERNLYPNRRRLSAQEKRGCERQFLRHLRV
jgi:hypothetical protein